MNKKDYIGLELAKHLHKKGFRGDSECCFTKEYARTDQDIPWYSYYQIMVEYLFLMLEINL